MNEIATNSLTLAGVFILGFSLNFTPCVYPMISVTVSLFGAQKERSRLRAFLKALVYVLGIATMYSVLGVAAAFGGVFLGALLQNPFVLIGIAILLVALALNMFGFSAFQVPSWILNKIGRRRGVGYFGFYLSGLFLGILAAPCIGPPMIAILAFVATRGDALFGFWVFFLMSLGLGIPYLVLGTFSSLLHRLPKSGIWLVWVEKLLGVILLSLAAYYLILVLNPSWFYWLIPVSLVLGGIYLGFVERSEQYPPFFIQFKRSAGILAVFLGVLIPLLGPRQTVAWEAYSPGKLVVARERNMPVIMNFHADWCLPCHELDRFTYSNPQVIEALSGFMKLKADVTRMHSPESGEILEQFSVLGVPTILFLDREGSEIEIARISGFISPENLLSILRSPRFQKEIGDQKQESTLNTKLLEMPREG